MIERIISSISFPTKKSQFLFKEYPQLQNFHLIKIYFQKTKNFPQANMGNSKVNRYQNIEFDPSEWKLVSTHNEYSVVNYLDPHQDRHIQKVAELWTVKLDSSRPKKDEQRIYGLYKMRNQTNFPFVKCIGTSLRKKISVGLCGEQTVFMVLTQRIIVRFDSFPQLTLPESLYVLKEVLTGYKELFKITGPFEPTPKMIGINENGHIKVWLNQNFALNTTSQQKQIKPRAQQIEQIKLSQPKMVEIIYHLIEQKCQQGMYPPELRSLLYSQGRTFASGIQLIQLFIKQKNLQIPARIHPNLNFIVLSHNKQIHSPKFGEQSITEPYDFAKNSNRKNNHYSKDLNKVVNFIHLQPKNNANLVSHMQSNGNHPSQVKGKSRIVHTPQTVIRKIRPSTSQQTSRRKIDPMILPMHSNIKQFHTQKHIKVETYNFLMANPNIMAVQSIYQPANKPNSPAHVRANIQNGFLLNQQLVQSEYYDSNSNFFKPRQQNHKKQACDSPYFKPQTPPNQTPTPQNRLPFNYIPENKPFIPLK